MSIARCRRCPGVYRFLPSVLQHYYQYLVCHFSSCCCCLPLPSYFYICTNVIYTSNFPKLFCGCQQTRYPFWCVCVRQKNQQQPRLCLMYIHVTRYGIYIKPRVVLIILRWGLCFSKAPLLLPSCAWQRALCYFMCQFTGTKRVELWRRRHPQTFKTSQCCCVSALYEAPTSWCDRSSALYC